MGVLMRGVQMPKNCEECNFKGECRNYWDKIREAYTRPSWCPLVEVADTPQTEEICERCVYVRGSQWCQGCNGIPKRWDGEKIVDTPQTELPKQIRTPYEGDIKTPQTETKAETQNSNLTFENRTMLDCYNCRRYKSDDACVECRYEPIADTPQTEVYDYKGNGIWERSE